MTKRRFSLVAAIAACLVSAAIVAQAADTPVTWVGTTSDMTDPSNWSTGNLPVASGASGTGAAVSFTDAAISHSPVMDADMTMKITSFLNDITSAYNITGTGKWTAGSTSNSSIIDNLSNADVTIDIGQLDMFRSGQIITGDWTASPADAGTGNLTIGHDGGSMVLRMTIGSNSNPYFAASNGSPNAGTTLTVYPKVDFTGSTSTTAGNNFALYPGPTSTIKLLGGITGGATPTSGNPSKRLHTEGDAGGKTILGDSTGWLGIAQVNISDLEINSSNSLGDSDPARYTEIAAGAAASALLLNKGSGSDIATAEYIYIYGRDAATSPQIKNTGGNNTLSGNIDAQNTAGFAVISSDGTPGVDSLTISGNIIRTGDTNGDLVLQGGSNGTVSGNITQTSTGIWNSVTKAGAGTWELSGVNDYAGTTIVNEGILRIANLGLADLADVYLKTGGTLNLTFSDTDTINSLIINNVSQPTGIWGAMGSGAAHETPLITGMGKLLVSTSATIPGDFNNDGLVDAADYVVWRKTMPGDVAKYDEWRANFGNPPGSGSSLGGGAAVPEPSTLALAVLAIIGLANSSRRGLARG